MRSAKRFEPVVSLVKGDGSRDVTPTSEASSKVRPNLAVIQHGFLVKV